MADKDFVELADLEEARDKVRWGRANKSRKIEQQERVATAYEGRGRVELRSAPGNGTVIRIHLPLASPKP